MSVLSSAIVNGIPGAIVGGFVGYQFLRGPLGADPIWLSAAVGAIIGGFANGIYGAVRETRKAQREQALQRVAQQRGQQFSAEVDGELSARLARDFSLDGAAISNVLRKEIAGASLVVGDLAIASEVRTQDDRKTRWSSQTAAFFTTDVRFPGFTLQPEGFALKLLSGLTGIEDINFASQPEFSRHYHLSAQHPENTRRLFDDRLLQHLGYRPGVYIRAVGGSLLIYRPETHLPAEQIEAFIADATEIFRLFEASARKLQEAMKAGLIPKSDPRAAAAKLPGFLGDAVRAALVTRADVEAFVRQPPPRKVPANIRRYCEAFAPGMFLAIGALFFVVGTGFTFGFGLKGEWGGALLGLLFAAVGAGLLFFLGRIRLRLERLLRHGELSVGRIENLESAGWSGPSGEVWRASVRFHATTGSVQATCKVAGATVERAQNLVKAKKSAAVLYDAANPQRFLLVDALLTVSPEYEE